MKLISMPLRNKKYTTSQIYQMLRQMIMDFDLFPGTRVTETELADLFKVSRTPIREALQRLEVEGLVQIKPKQGCFIRPVDIELISEYYDVRVALEGMAIELACKNMPRNELQALADFWNPENVKQTVDYPEQIKEVEEAFHLSLAQGSGNPVLAQYLNDVNDHIRIIRRLGFPDKKSIVETYEEHYQICQLMLDGKTKAAKKYLIEHIRKSQDIARTVTLSQLQQHHMRDKSRKNMPVLRKLRQNV